MSDDATRRTFGNRYEVVKRVGAGGMAEVFKAFDTTLERMVAVKVMLPKFAEDPTFMKGFRNEAKAAAGLTDPHVVSIYDWGQDGNCCYIVMEYVRGIDLRRALRTQGVIHPRKAAEIASQVCEALAQAHERGIVHRDIKAANIMMQANGVIKLMDFGIASRKNDPEADSGPTLGTVQYMSPEQIRNTDVGPASDLYSLGIVMYEMCTGVLPFTAANSKQTARRHLSDAPIPPIDLSPKMDPMLNDLILKALAKDVSERFANAQDMRKNLDDYIVQRKSGTTPHGTYPSCWALGFSKGPDTLRGTVKTLETPAVLGRDAACNIVLEDASVSRRHLHMVPRGRYLEIADLNSSNGTDLNGSPVHCRTLCKPGDTIRVGRVEFKLGCK